MKWERGRYDKFIDHNYYSSDNRPREGLVAYVREPAKGPGTSPGLKYSSIYFLSFIVGSSDIVEHDTLEAAKLFVELMLAS